MQCGLGRVHVGAQVAGAVLVQRGWGRVWVGESRGVSLLTFQESQWGRLQTAIPRLQGAATSCKYELIAKDPGHDHVTVGVLGCPEL